MNDDLLTVAKAYRDLWLICHENTPREPKVGENLELGHLRGQLFVAIDAALQSPARVAEDEKRIYTKADMEAACALVLAGFRSKPMLDKMVDRFLAWPLPFSVCADLVATRQEHGRIGTNLLTATEAREMLDYVLQAVVHSTELRK